MNKLPHQSQQLLFNYLLNLSNYHTFKESVILDRNFKTYLGSGLFQSLINGFKDEDKFKKTIQDSLKLYVNWDKYEIKKLKHYLMNLATRKSQCEESLKACYELYCNGYDFLEEIGNTGDRKVICQRFDYCEWVELPAKEKAESLKKIYPTIQETSLKIIKWLDKGLIKPSGKTNRYGKFEYIDLRAYDGKLSMLNQSKKNLHLKSKLAVRNTKRQWNDMLDFVKSNTSIPRDGILD